MVVRGQVKSENSSLPVAVRVSETREAKSGKYFQIWFSPRFGGKNGGFLSMRMQNILNSRLARPDSAPIGGGKKEEFTQGMN